MSNPSIDFRGTDNSRPTSQQRGIENKGVTASGISQQQKQASTTPSKDSNNLSGAHWRKIADDKGWKNSTDIEALSDAFKPKVKEFIQALKEAKKKNSSLKFPISTTKRHEVRAWLMHWAWEISKGKSPPTNDPHSTGIIWDHGTSAKTKKAAEQMKKAFKMAYPAALDSRHISGNAIDITITWSGNLEIMNKVDPKPIIINNEPRHGGKEGAANPGGNTKLHEVGGTYGVKKLVKDPPHWSDTGG